MYNVMIVANAVSCVHVKRHCPRRAGRRVYARIEPCAARGALQIGLHRVASHVLVEHLPVGEAGKVKDGVAGGTANWAPPRKLHVLGARFAQAPVPTRGEQLRPFCIETDDTRRVIVHFQY